MFKARIAVLPMLALIACGSSPTPGSSGSAAGDDNGPTVESLGGPPGSGVCVPSAPATFANAVCVCDDLVEGGTLTTHAPATGAASVGINGHTGAGTAMNVEGDLASYGGMAAGGYIKVRDNVYSTKTVDGAGVLDVGKDLSVGGSFGFIGALTVDGTLRLADPSLVLVPIHIGNTGPYVAPAGPPCACDPSALLPIAKAVAAAATSNDNAAQGLGTDGASLLGAGKLVLPSGKYYFDNITRIGLGKIVISGAVSLYFDGSLTNLGVGVIQIEPGASLDLYVNGLLATAGAVALGDPAHPEAFRLFVGGAGSMIVTAGVQLWSGLIYAPQAVISFGGVTAIRGSVFAKNLIWAGALDVTYPGAATGSGSTCPPPPAPGPTAK